MKKLALLLLLAIFLVGCVGCSKGKIVEKKYYPAKIPEVSEEYTIVIEDRKGNKNRIAVTREDFDSIQIGDEY